MACSVASMNWQQKTAAQRLRASWCPWCLSLLLPLCQTVTADVKQLSASTLEEQPVWVQNRSTDIILDFSKADPYYKHPSLGVVSIRDKPMRVNFHIGYYHGNVAVVRYGTKFVMAVRKMQFYKTLRSAIENYPLSTKKDEEYISWWGSKLSVCSVDTRTLQPVACEDYDPRTWKECEWSKGFEGEGPEDPRLIVWPGKGLFMMFGSKPWPKDTSGTEPEQTACEGPWAFQPWLIQLQPYSPQQDPADPWSKGIIRLQYLSGEPPKQGELLKEKNWNPFTYKGKLFFSQVGSRRVAACSSCCCSRLSGAAQSIGLLQWPVHSTRGMCNPSHLQPWQCFARQACSRQLQLMCHCMLAWVGCSYRTLIWVIRPRLKLGKGKPFKASTHVVRSWSAES
eukprot:GHRR01016938.1.p1 GENE.GHRR01016938.1~~GHRR01016938.1.p1  ORF type:complete len:395 (+),score=66.63 GHRR01016938.1:322-1506(+)